MAMIRCPETISNRQSDTWRIFRLREPEKVCNYSSPFWMRYAPWVVGQLSPTQIHRVTLSIRP